MNALADAQFDYHDRFSHYSDPWVSDARLRGLINLFLEDVRTKRKKTERN
jgi:hypothetical protein